MNIYGLKIVEGATGTVTEIRDTLNPQYSTDSLACLSCWFATNAKKNIHLNGERVELADVLIQQTNIPEMSVLLYLGTCLFGRTNRLTLPKTRNSILLRQMQGYTQNCLSRGPFEYRSDKFSFQQFSWSLIRSHTRFSLRCTTIPIFSRGMKQGMPGTHGSRQMLISSLPLAPQQNPAPIRSLVCRMLCHIQDAPDVTRACSKFLPWQYFASMAWTHKQFFLIIVSHPRLATNAWFRSSIRLKPRCHLKILVYKCSPSFRMKVTMLICESPQEIFDLHIDVPVHPLRQTEYRHIVWRDGRGHRLNQYRPSSLRKGSSFPPCQPIIHGSQNVWNV